MIRFRRAARDDAPVLAELINIASEGLAEVFWQAEAGPGGDAWAWGREFQAEKLDTGAESWLAESGGEVVAALTGYPVGLLPKEGDWPPMLTPLIELEFLAPDTWYINVLATRAGHRGRGHATHLLELAEHRARTAGLDALSLVVSDGNGDALRLYHRCGFDETARRPMVKDGWTNPGRNWLLMVRRLATTAA